MRSTPWRTPGRRDRDDLRVAVTAGDVRDAAAAGRLDAETPRTDRPRPHPQVSRPRRRGPGSSGDYCRPHGCGTSRSGDACTGRRLSRASTPHNHCTQREQGSPPSPGSYQRQHCTSNTPSPTSRAGPLRSRGSPMPAGRPGFGSNASSGRSRPCICGCRPRLRHRRRGGEVPYLPAREHLGVH